MKFESSIHIDAPIDKVVTLFSDPANFKEWQTGFVSYEPISGTPGTAGAKSKIKYVNKGHNIELTETIETMKLPAKMTAFYEHKHGENSMTSSFTELPGNKTRYTSTVGNIKAKGLMPKLMLWLAPGMMKKHNEEWLSRFKDFVERTA